MSTAKLLSMDTRTVVSIVPAVMQAAQLRGNAVMDAAAFGAAALRTAVWRASTVPLEHGPAAMVLGICICIAAPLLLAVFHVALARSEWAELPWSRRVFVASCTKDLLNAVTATPCALAALCGLLLSRPDTSLSCAETATGAAGESSLMALKMPALALVAWATPDPDPDPDPNPDPDHDPDPDPDPNPDPNQVAIEMALHPHPYTRVDAANVLACLVSSGGVAARGKSHLEARQCAMLAGATAPWHVPLSTLCLSVKYTKGCHAPEEARARSPRPGCPRKQECRRRPLVNIQAHARARCSLAARSCSGPRSPRSSTRRTRCWRACAASS